MRVCVAMFLASTVAISTADGDEWPQPALGPSKSGDPEILFTFDDGPDGHNTPRILETLRRHGVHAIFFVAGWRVQTKGPNGDVRREVARQLLASGQLLGNHTLNHVQLCQLTREEGGVEIDETNRLLVELSGMPVPFFRVPYGARCKQIDSLLGERGLRHLHWDLDPQEYVTHSSEETTTYFIENLRRLQGRAVILLHDTKSTTARTLPAILDWIKNENALRVSRGERPIRILSYADIAREQMAPGLLPLLDQASRAAKSFAPDVARQLLAPLCGSLPVHAAQL